MPLQIIRQDITKMEIDAIVNTTNEEMVGYSGVDLAIHRAAGTALDEECARIAPLKLGEAKATWAYALPCNRIIHTRGPVWKGGGHGERDALRSAYLSSLRLAEELCCETVAFPLISAGNYGYPKEEVLSFAISTIADFLTTHDMTVYLCVFDKDSYALGKKLFDDIEEYIDDNYARAVYEEACYSFSLDESCDEKPVRRRISPCVAPSPLDDAQLLGKRKSNVLGGRFGVLDLGFRDKLFRLIDEKGLTDVACYKKANVDKRLFSKIKSQAEYRPSKQTVLAFSVALELDIDKTQELLATVGLTLSRSILFDVIVLYFLENGIYDIFKINEVLFHYDQPLLGSV